MDIHDGSDQAYDWNPSDLVDDQVQAYDELRERCPVAHSATQEWSLLRHADVLAALRDPATFSSQVSTHVAVPNGMDAAEHTAFRALVDRCFTPERVAGYAPTLRSIAEEVVATLPSHGQPIEIMSLLSEPYAAQAQCAFMGWPPTVADALRRWSADSQRATREHDRVQLDRVAAQFDAIIRDQLDVARTHPADGSRSITGQLLDERVNGRSLTDDELVSIVRNWTAGELGTISAAVGIIVEFLARNPDVYALLRSHPDQRQAAMDEMLRLRPPLVTNRRRTTRRVRMHDRVIPADAAVTIAWPAVQRDPAAFAEPTQFDLGRDSSQNLLYGRGPHYCPGEGLSRLELGVLLDTLLSKSPSFRLSGAAVPARPPAGGFETVPIVWIQPG